jgi:enoyl-[acyl-carrier protein] reductase/trans-2-enoyl-CoA reductase (NAD+)
VPLYVSLLFKVMKDLAVHEDPIRHIDRLFRSHVYDSGATAHFDTVGRLRVHDRELRDDVQAHVKARWGVVNTENLMELSDLAGFRRDFLRIFGFEAGGVDYEKDVSPLD